MKRKEYILLKLFEPILCTVKTAVTRVRPVLVKHMIIIASYVNKWTFIKEKCTLLERLPHWPTLVCVTYNSRDKF